MEVQFYLVVTALYFVSAFTVNRVMALVVFQEWYDLYMR